MITTKTPEIDLEEFLEDCLDIHLLPYQKELLRRMRSTDKIYIHMGQHLDKVDIRSIYEMTHFQSLEEQDVRNK